MASRKMTRAGARASAFFKEEQHNLSPLAAGDIYAKTMSWLYSQDCVDAVPEQLIIQYSMAAARWQQAEQAVSAYGMIGKGKAGEAAPSPFVSIAGTYQRQAMQLWQLIGEAAHRKKKENAKALEIQATTQPHGKLAQLFDDFNDTAET